MHRPAGLVARSSATAERAAPHSARPDSQACSTSTQCCSATCSAGACAPLNPSCRTAGNSCARNEECCSKVCRNGVCDGRVSFCTQLGDACTRDLECCGGVCTKAAGATLGPAPWPTRPVSEDARPQVRSAAEPRRACRRRAYAAVNAAAGRAAPTDRRVSSSASRRAAAGPRVSSVRATRLLRCSRRAGLGEGRGWQRADADVHCSKAPGAAVGRCDNGQACSPAGAICRLAITSCNATDRCCSGTVQTHPLNCKQDLLGIPRCTAGARSRLHGGQHSGAWEPCASSADCCNRPCVPNPTGSPPSFAAAGRAFRMQARARPRPIAA